MRTDFTKAFINNRTLETEDESVTFKTHQIGELIVPTGFITACDPFVFYDSAAFTTQIPIGKYPVILSVAGLSGHERIAYAKLHISEVAAVRWEMALLPAQNKNSLQADEIFGYPVDAGTGCFMDAEAAAVLLRKMGEESLPNKLKNKQNYSDYMFAEMEKNHTLNWDWANLKLEETAGNVITFKSGWGDGVYASYFGFDAGGNVTALVTDFCLVEDTDVYSKD